MQDGSRLGKILSSSSCPLAPTGVAVTMAVTMASVTLHIKSNAPHQVHSETRQAWCSPAQGDGSTALGAVDTSEDTKIFY